MIQTILKPWHALGTTGKLILCLTIFFFIGKSLGHR